MKYMGSKNKIAKHLLPFILERLKPDQHYVEPFVGGANMMDKVDHPFRIGADLNYHLIEMWRALQKGWSPPDFVSEELWRDVRVCDDLGYDPHFIAFVRLGCSFGADWNGGYARNIRKNKPGADLLNSTTKSYCKQSKNNILKQIPFLQNVDFRCCSYQDLALPPESLIYCDPPYRGTTGYKMGFDNDIFWQWCRDKAAEGHVLLISEYSAPADFECLWALEIRNTLNNTAETKRAEEKLFIFNDLL